jgi:hypothetical protein
MPRAIYVPVFDSFFEGSIMHEDLPTRFVMLALIRLAWRSGALGEVDVDPGIFAASINIPLPDVERAIRRLMEPDPASGNPDEDGRRIVPIHPDRPFRGWRLVNWPRYRVMVNRINDAARQREAYHARKDISKVSESLQTSPGVSEIPENPVTRRDETKRDETNTPKAHRRSAPKSDESFERFWTEYPRRVGKGEASKAWSSLSAEDKALALKAAPAFKEAWAGSPERKFLAHPATWLNKGRWNDDPAEWWEQAWRDHPDELRQRRKAAEIDAERRRIAGPPQEEP